MVLFLTLALIVSAAGMSVLLLLKHYELTTGHMLFASSRPAVSKWAARKYFLFGTVLPQYVSWQSSRAFKALRAWMHRTTARVVLWVERTLERVLHTVKQKTEGSRTPGEASAFLREVAEHKKKLTENSDESTVQK